MGFISEMADVLQPPLSNANGLLDNDNKDNDDAKDEKEVAPSSVKQIASGLDSVMVSGMLRNISDKVATKLKQESEEELVDIMVKKMGEKEGDGGGIVSWEEWPTGDHLMANPTAGRVKAGPKRPPTIGSRRREGSEEDFDSLLAAMEGESEATSMVEVEEDLDDAFDSLLKESTQEETDIDGAEESLRKRSVDDDFNLLLEDNDIKEEELVQKEVEPEHKHMKGEQLDHTDFKKDKNQNKDTKKVNSVEKVELVSTEEESSGGEEDEEEANLKVGEEVIKAPMMSQEQDAKADNKEGDAAREVTPPPKWRANEGQAPTRENEPQSSPKECEASLESTENEPKSGSKDPFDELFEELADGEIEADEGFQKIFGQGGADLVTAAVDTPTPQVFQEQISGGENEEQSGGKFTEEGQRIEEREYNENDAFESPSDEEEIEKRSEEEEGAFNQLLADQEIKEKLDSEKWEEKGSLGEESLETVINKEVGEIDSVGGLEPVDRHQENVKVTNSINNNDEKEKRVIEIEEVIDEARVRELAQELAREVVEKERAKHKEEVISMAREVVGEREVFTDRIDRLENEVEVLRGEVLRGQGEVERLLGVVEEQAAQLAGAREEVKVLSGLREEGPGEAGKRVVALERELEDQREVNAQLKAYVGEVLVNIMLKNPQILERKA